MKQLRKMAQRGLLDPEQEDPFALFVASTAIRWVRMCAEHETQGRGIKWVAPERSTARWCLDL
jgi:hypothetical protein